MSASQKENRVISWITFHPWYCSYLTFFSIPSVKHCCWLMGPEGQPLDHFLLQAICLMKKTKKTRTIEDSNHWPPLSSRLKICSTNAPTCPSRTNHPDSVKIYFFSRYHPLNISAADGSRWSASWYNIMIIFYQYLTFTVEGRCRMWVQYVILTYYAVAIEKYKNWNIWPMEIAMLMAGYSPKLKYLAQRGM